MPRTLPMSALKMLTALVFLLGALAGSAARAQSPGPRPCDLLAAATPCVAAYSTTRALYSGYTGPLYQVTRQSDDAQVNVTLLPDGYADVTKEDAFCAGVDCLITKLYDQSAHHNDLVPAPAGGAAHGLGPNGYDEPAHARTLPVMAGGHAVYGLTISPGMGYRIDHPTGTAVHGQPEGVYMVTSALNLNAFCCFDFGNAEANNLDNNAGHMDAINIMCQGQIPCGANAGLDMENGIYGHLKVPDTTEFVTDMGANDGQHQYAIYQGNAQHGHLTTTGLIPLPTGYQPMQQEGAIILGIGGDNSDSASGYFFEGVMTQGMPTAKALEAVQKNIVDAKYASVPTAPLDPQHP